MSDAQNTAQARNPRQLKRDFAEVYDVHAEFLATPQKRYSVWVIFPALEEFFDELPKYQQTFGTRELPDGFCGSNEFINSALWAVGSFPVKDGTNGVLWANPQYCHSQETIPKMDSRMHHIEQAIRYPTVTREALADRFGMTNEELSELLAEHGIEFEARRTRQQRRIGRSMRCVTAWAGRSISELSRLMPVPNETARDWALNLATEGTWSAPDEPTTAKWY